MILKDKFHTLSCLKILMGWEINHPVSTHLRPWRIFRALLDYTLFEDVIGEITVESPGKFRGFFYNYSFLLIVSFYF